MVSSLVSLWASKQISLSFAYEINESFVFNYISPSISVINKQLCVFVQSSSAQSPTGLLKLMKFNNMVKRVLVASSLILIIFSRLMKLLYRCLLICSGLIIIVLWCVCLSGFSCSQRPGFDCFKLCVCAQVLLSVYVTCKYSLCKLMFNMTMTQVDWTSHVSAFDKHQRNDLSMRWLETQETKLQLP